MIWREMYSQLLSSNDQIFYDLPTDLDKHAPLVSASRTLRQVAKRLSWIKCQHSIMLSPLRAPQAWLLPSFLVAFLVLFV